VREFIMSDLHAAAIAGDLAAITMALDVGAPLNARDERGCTPVMAATYARQTDAVRLLFRRGASPDLRDSMLNSPFLYAGAEGLLDILIAANEAGADPSIPNRYGGVAIIPAAEHGHLDVIRYLLEETKIDINHVNNLGWTALLEAIILSDGGPRHQQVVQLLLSHGADPNLRDAEGVSPLGHARQRGYDEICTLLTEAGGIV
jgi:ankyrin repeat protein